MNLNKRKKSLEQIAKEINLVIRGKINYYYPYCKDEMRNFWKLFNARQLKWVKWERRMNKHTIMRYLKTKYKVHPNFLDEGYWYSHENIYFKCDLLTLRAL